MSLHSEIELNRPFHSSAEEALLAFVWTHQQMTKLSADFFRAYGLSDTQFNALMIIADYQRDGIRQFELARRLLINRASTGTLIDVMTKKGWILRQRVADDRRAYQLILTQSGETLLETCKPPYYALIAQSFSDLGDSEIKQFTGILNRFRAGVTAALQQAIDS